MKFVQEFKEFIMRGNVIDMAVGIVIGASFTSIVNSFVKDILMPPLALLTGGIDFSDKVIVLKEATESTNAITINYGVFLNSLISFLIVAFAIFVVIKQINRLKKEEPAQAPTEKECKYCLSKIPINATKCKFCSSEVG